MNLNFANSLRSLGLLALSISLAGCATNPVSGKREVVLMSENQEIAKGAQYHKEFVLKQYQVYEAPELQAYVNDLGQRLAAISHRNNLDFTFTLLDSPEVNAFALPGGYVYITRGIMAYMNSEEDLAGVLGHEIGHVTARHSVRQERSQTLTSLGVLLAAIATKSNQIAQTAGQLGTAWVRGYGRKHELEADRLGAEYLARADYDPEKMLDVVGILKDQELFEIQRAREEGREPRVYHGVFSTHPRNDLRLQEVVRAAKKYKNPNAIQTNPERFLRLMDRVTFGYSEEQGIPRGNRFYHKPLDFTMSFPKNWRLQNQPSQLLALRPDGSAAIIVTIDQLNGGESPAQYVSRKFKNFTNGQHTVSGGYTGLAVAQTPYGNREVRVVSVPHKGQVLVVAGFARGQRPDGQIIETANSIRRLKSSERKLASAKSIKLVRTKSGDTFARLARKSDLESYAVDQLRLINGMYPDGEPRPGQLIKIVQ